MNEYLIGGHISLASVIDNKSRTVNKIILDKDRQSRVSSASYHFPEKAQYKKILRFAEENAVPVESVSAEEFSRLTLGESYGGIAAVVGDRKFDDPASLMTDSGFALLLDGIEDPFNFGYVLRTAYASGVDCVFLPRRNYFTSAATVIRSSAGASEMLRIALYDDESALCGMLRENGYDIVCTAKTENAVPFEKAEYRRPMCLAIGGEKRGINKALLSDADKIVCIDYKNSYSMSLSASSAASILIYGIASRI